MLADALEHLVCGIVDHPEDVRLSRRNYRGGQLLEIHVHPDDLGRVIGRNGGTVIALRKVVNSLKSTGFVRVDVVETGR